MIARACRVAVGLTLAWSVWLAVTGPELALSSSAAALLILGVSVWRADLGLIALVVLAPVGALAAPAPAHGAELFAWSFLSGWLLNLRRPLAPAGWTAAAVPALLLGACAVASWLGLTLAGAGGVPAARLPILVWRLVPADYLLFSTSATETVAVVTLVTGLAVFLAAAALVRSHVGVTSALTRGLVASLTLLAAATTVRVWTDWAASGYGSWLIDRYVNDLAASRFSVHIKDLNAAASLYTLGALTAATLAATTASRRWVWGAAAVLMLPALWVSGSRTALFGAAAAGMMALLANCTRGWSPTRTRLVTAVAAILFLTVVAVTLATSRGSINGVGSASSALTMRTQFAQTSARMFASAPLLGVGVGQYHGRSAEFMPAPLRSVYQNENAHNYFAQVFAELGAVGGGLLLWLAGSVLIGAASRSRAGGDAASGALFVGCAAYLLTCIAGHPLLVAEAAVPFWAAFGALAAQAPDLPGRRGRGILAAVCVILAVGLAASVRAYRSSEERPPVGLYAQEQASDGTAYSWTTRHVVVSGGRSAGFVRLVLRAPDRDTPRPFVAETWVGGRIVDRVEVPRDRWLVREIPIQGAVRTPSRRIDVWINQAWMPPGTPNAPDPPTYGVMAAELRWAGPGSR